MDKELVEIYNKLKVEKGKAYASAWLDGCEYMAKRILAKITEDE